jgi:ribose-phosphate pyrophosphokinase
MLDAARGASAAHITAVIPHYSYARSDKKDAPRISIGARLVADMIATAGATRVLTMALHTPQVHGFFTVPVDHLSAVKELAQHFSGRDLHNTVVVSRDWATPRWRASSPESSICRLLPAPSSGSRTTLCTSTELSVTSMVATSSCSTTRSPLPGSIVELLRKLREEGVQEISLACTHGLFTGPAIERLKQEPNLNEIVITNTVPLPPGEAAASHRDSVRGAVVR